MKNKLTRVSVAKGLLASLLGLALIGCSGVPTKQPGEEPAKRPVEDFVKPDVTYAVDIYDPFEGFNRGVYYFNAKFDQYLYLPLVSGYEFIMPDYVEDRISNFFSNIYEINNFTNNALQLKGMATLKTVGRVAINTTIGILGFWDHATKFGIPEQDEDFGQTLGHYGVGNGPYLVLPIFGPSNLRDTTGLVVDAVAFTAIDPLDFDDHSEREFPFYLLSAIDKRHRESFRYYETGSPFEYDLVRMFYTKARKIQIAK